MARKRDQRIIDASFDVWLSRDILFNDPPGYNIKTYRRYTKAEKVKYTKKIQVYLDKMENDWFKHEHENRTAVAIKLNGIVRYVWRDDVLIKKEYNEVKEKQQDNLRILFKKSEGSMVKGSAS